MHRVIVTESNGLGQDFDAHSSKNVPLARPCFYVKVLLLRKLLDDLPVVGMRSNLQGILHQVERPMCAREEDIDANTSGGRAKRKALSCVTPLQLPLAFFRIFNIRHLLRKAAVRLQPQSDTARLHLA